MDNQTEPGTARQTVTPEGDLPAWTTEDIDRMAQVTPAALQDARADALRSDPELAAMLEATQE